TELARRQGNISQSYPVSFRGNPATPAFNATGVNYPAKPAGVPFFDAEQAYKHFKESVPPDQREALMSEIIMAKLTQHPHLRQAITKNGGVKWLEQCEHTVIGNIFWEGKGKGSGFVRALMIGYEQSLQQARTGKPENPYLLVPYIGHQNPAKERHRVKDRAMAQQATKFIGFVQEDYAKVSSTQDYLNNWKKYGLANTGKYTSSDVVMVSGHGDWNRNAQGEQISPEILQNLFQEKYAPELEKAISVQATIVVGNARGMDQLIRGYLQEKGYNFTNQRGFVKATAVAPKQDTRKGESRRPTYPRIQMVFPLKGFSQQSPNPLTNAPLKGKPNQTGVTTTFEAMRGHGRVHTTRTFKGVDPYTAWKVKEGDYAIAYSGNQEILCKVGKQYPITPYMINDPQFRQKWGEMEKHHPDFLLSYHQGYEQKGNTNHYGMYLEPIGDYKNGKVYDFETGKEIQLDSDLEDKLSQPNQSQASQAPTPQPKLNLFTAVASHNNYQSIAYTFEDTLQQSSSELLENTPLLKAEGMALAKGLLQANQYAQSKGETITVVVNTSRSDLQNSYKQHKNWFDQKFPQVQVAWSIISEHDPKLQATLEAAQKGLQNLHRDGMRNPKSHSQDLQWKNSQQLIPSLKALYKTAEAHGKVKFNPQTQEHILDGKQYKLVHNSETMTTVLLDKQQGKQLLHARYDETQKAIIPLPVKLIDPTQPNCTEEDVQKFNQVVADSLKYFQGQESRSQPTSDLAQ
ncbi:MAG: hypothetical protein AB4058_08885, partial [Microcystaceae cyanobacterium]